MRLLVVEDEQKVARFVTQGLEEEGYAVDVATDGEMGLSMALDHVHDLIILDIQLPKASGDDLQHGEQSLLQQHGDKALTGNGELACCPEVANPVHQRHQHRVQ